jgi:hypothetical protein
MHWAADRPGSREKLALLSKIVVRGLQSYWRLTRGATFAAEACLIDEKKRVGLVRCTSGEGWLLPRTPVCKGEALEQALQRFLKDTHGIQLNCGLTPFWIYDESSSGSGGWVALFVIADWKAVPPSGASDLAFFARTDLPPGLDARDAARICQAAEGRTPFEVC